jgi:hypothetical protein
MATSIAIEVESGTSYGQGHRHNGYYAGEFSRPRPTRPSLRPAAATRPVSRATSGWRHQPGQ